MSSPHFKIFGKMTLFFNLSARKFYPLSFVLIFALTIAIYSNSLYNEFVNWDDQDLIVNNSAIRSLKIDNLKRIFQFHRGSTYQPMRVLSYAIDYHFWGLNPVGYHIHNIALHGFSGFFLLLALINGLPKIIGLNNKNLYEIRAIALLTSFLFVVHPVNVEAVTWLSGRKYTLLVFFAFLSFYFFVKSSNKSPYNLFYVFAANCCFILSVMSSPFGVVLPAIFFLFDFCQDIENNPFKVLKKNFYKHIFYLVLGLIVFGLLFNALVGYGSGGADKSHYMNNPIYTFLTMLRVLFDYVKNFILPIKLNCRYPNYISFSVWEYKVLIAIIGLIIIVYKLYKQMLDDNKTGLFCFGWFMISWLPVSNIISISTAMADRYIYLASVGFFLYLSIFIHLFFLNETSYLYQKKGLLGGYIAILLIVTFLSSLTIQRNSVWKNSFTLWKDSLEKDSNNLLANTNMGGVYFKRNDFDKAIYYFYKAYLIKPDHFAVNYNLASAYMEKRLTEKAIEYYRKHLEIRPKDLQAYLRLAKIYAQKNDIDKALYYYSKASELSPKSVSIYIKIAKLFELKGESKEIIKTYQTILSITPNNIESLTNFANHLMDIGRVYEALKHYLKVVDVSPKFAEGYYNVGRFFYMQGDFEKSKQYYLKALEYNNKYPEVYNSVGNIYLLQGRFDEAISNYNDALLIRPTYAEAYYNMGNAFALQGIMEEAIKHYKKALQLRPDYDAVINVLKQIENSAIK